MSDARIGLLCDLLMFQWRGEKEFDTKYAEGLAKVFSRVEDPMSLGIAMAVAMVRYTWMSKHLIGKEWYDFRDRLYAQLPSETRDDIMRGLMEVRFEDD